MLVNLWIFANCLTVTLRCFLVIAESLMSFSNKDGKAPPKRFWVKVQFCKIFDLPILSSSYTEGGENTPGQWRLLNTLNKKTAGTRGKEAFSDEKYQNIVTLYFNGKYRASKTYGCRFADFSVAQGSTSVRSWTSSSRGQRGFFWIFCRLRALQISGEFCILWISPRK